MPKTVFSSDTLPHALSTLVYAWETTPNEDTPVTPTDTSIPEDGCLIFRAPGNLLDDQKNNIKQCLVSSGGNLNFVYSQHNGTEWVALPVTVEVAPVLP